MQIQAGPMVYPLIWIVLKAQRTLIRTILMASCQWECLTKPQIKNRTLMRCGATQPLNETRILPKGHHPLEFSDFLGTQRALMIFKYQEYALMANLLE